MEESLKKQAEALNLAGYDVVPHSENGGNAAIGVIVFILVIILIIGIVGGCTNGFTNINNPQEEPKNLPKGMPCAKLGLPQNKYCASNSCKFDFSKANYFCV